MNVGPAACQARWIIEDPKFLWDCCLQRLYKDDAYWKKMIEDKVNQETRTRLGAGGGGAAVHPSPLLPVKPAPKQPKDRLDPNAKDAHGNFRASKEGLALCGGFNYKDGGCPSPCKNGRAHACSVCQSTEHCAMECPNKPENWQKPPPPWQNQRGKGKGGGKGGKRR